MTASKHVRTAYLMGTLKMAAIYGLLMQSLVSHASKRSPFSCEDFLKGMPRLEIPFEITVEKNGNLIEILAHESGPDEKVKRVFAELEFEFRGHNKDFLYVHYFSGSLSGRGKDLAEILFSRIFTLYPQINDICIKLPETEIPLFLRNLSRDYRPSEAIALSKTVKLISKLGYSALQAFSVKKDEDYIVVEISLSRSEQ